MDGSSDVMDILDMSGHDSRKGNIISGDSVKKVISNLYCCALYEYVLSFYHVVFCLQQKKPKKLEIRKPKEMPRELWGLLWTDNMYVFIIYTSSQ